MRVRWTGRGRGLNKAKCSAVSIDKWACRVSCGSREHASRGGGWGVGKPTGTIQREREIVCAKCCSAIGQAAGR